MSLPVSTCLTKMPILFVSLEKGKLAKILYSSDIFAALVIFILSCVLSSKIIPILSANFTNATSSGLEALRC